MEINILIMFPIIIVSCQLKINILNT
jgi:hypothetical protein